MRASSAPIVGALVAVLASSCSPPAAPGDSGVDVVIAPPPCADGALGLGEVDVDCGGTCPPCGVGSRCEMTLDCSTGVCLDGRCAEPSCGDGLRNVAETDIDCGGPTCAPCGRGRRCSAPIDCAARVCTRGLCVVPTCFDSVRNGSETDVDCGGAGCSRCEDGAECAGDDDCESGSCAGGECASCMDGVTNGDETDVDCGGTDCAVCDSGRACGSPINCSSGVCTDGLCVPPRCEDGVWNGEETDVDCGGPCAPCPDAGRCLADGDCVGMACVGGHCQGGPRLGWVKDLVPPGGTRAETEILAIAATADGGLVMVARFASRAQLDPDDVIDAPTPGGRAAFIATFAPDGTLRWVHRLGNDRDGGILGGRFDPVRLAVATDGAIVVAGTLTVIDDVTRFADLGDGRRDWGTDYFVPFVSTFEPDGRHRWVTRIDGSVRAITVAGTQVVVGGGMGDSGSYLRALALADGRPEWIRHVGSAGSEVDALSFDDGSLHAALRMHLTAVIAGVRVEPRGELVSAIVRLDADGVVRGLDGVLDNDGSGLGVSAEALAATEHGLLWAGRATGRVDLTSTTHHAAGSYDGLVVRMAPDGSESGWMFGSALYDTLTSLAVRPDGGWVITGIVRGTVDLGAGPVIGGDDDLDLATAFVAEYGPDGEHEWSRLLGLLPGFAFSPPVPLWVALGPDGSTFVAEGSVVHHLVP